MAIAMGWVSFQPSVTISCPLASGTARSYRIALGMTTEINFLETSSSWPWFSSLGVTDHCPSPAQGSSSTVCSATVILGVPSKTFGDF